MDTICFRVTSKVLAQVNKSTGQEQIALREPTKAISLEIAQASKASKLKMRVAEQIDIWVGDTGAIWRNHNLENVEGFDALFSLLSKYPDKDFLLPVRVLQE